MERIIYTERLVLRPVKFEDAPALSRMAGDYHIARMTGSIPSPFPIISAEIRTMLFESAWRRGLEYSYAISVEGGELIGIVSLFRRSETSDFELGYWLGRPYWGNGYMTEACRALIDCAEDRLGVTTLTAGVFSDNPGSVRILEKLGFTNTGVIDQYFSIARLCKAESLNFIRRKGASLLRAEQAPRIEA